MSKHAIERLDFAGFGGVRLAGDAFGSPEDPAVLLLPTAGQSRAYWHGSAQALADAGRYAICVDLRGHGDSEHPADGRYDLDAYVGDLKAILNGLKSRAVVVAAGMSAIVAIAATGGGAAHPVAGLALVDATIWFDSALVERLRDALVLRTGRFESATAVIDAIAALHPEEPRPIAVDRLLAAYQRGEDGLFGWRGDPRAFTPGARPHTFGALDELAAGIGVPVTLIRGSLNQNTSAETALRLQAVIPGAEIAEIEGAGHYAAIDHEEAFNGVLLDFIERRAPRRPLTYIEGSEPRILRDALGCFGTGVTIVTTIGPDGQPIGLTANSFTSVSLDPPLLLFSLSKKSANLETFRNAGRFAVNVLHIGQQPVANRFARPDAPRFESIDWSVDETGGSPILEGSLASFDCKTFAVHEGGDHLIFIGQVERASFEPHRDPLLYFRGKYRRLHFA